MGATPNYNALLGVIWGDWFDGSDFASLSGASNIIVGTNPPYSKDDFFAIYPQFNNAAFPDAVINAYIYLATSSLVQARYFEMWPMVMALFIAHYLTMYAQSAQSPNTTMAQIAGSGLALGIKTSKSAGDVNVGMSILDDLKGWGTFQLTQFGQQFASIAKVIGSAPMQLY
jgi:hypothetical protein